MSCDKGTTMRQCLVCLDYTKRSHLNYGADACFSCRAFFRRAHQKCPKSIPNFQCKNGNQCNVNAKNRRRCQKCRYDRCLQYGMKPECVLDDGQRRSRFRKPFVRKTSNSCSDQSRGLDRYAKCLDSIDESEVQNESEIRNETQEMDEYLNGNEDSIFEPDVEDAQSPRYQPPLDSTMDLIQPWEVEKGKKIEGVEDVIELINLCKENTLTNDYSQWSRMDINADRISHLKMIWTNNFSYLSYDYWFIYAMVSFHHGGPTPSVQALKQYLLTLRDFFWHLAGCFQTFGIPLRDLNVLVERNTPLFIHLVLGKYASSASGRHQLQWLLMLKLPHYLQIPVANCSKLEPHFQALLGHHLEEYIRFSSKLSEGQVDLPDLALISVLILLKTDPNTCLDQPDKVKIQFKALLHHIETSPNSSSSTKSDILHTLHTVQTMANKFLLHSSTGCYWRYQMTVPYSNEEENWTVRQFQLFDQTFRQISFGEDLVKEFIMFAFDVPVSQRFLPESFKICTQRFHDIFLLHEESARLTRLDRKIMWNQNLLLAVAVWVTKCESYETGIDQLKFNLGCSDTTVYNENYGSFLEQKSIKKFTMLDINWYTALMSREVCERFSALVKHLSKCVEDTDNYKLLCLICILTPDNMECTSSMQRLQAQYINLLKRRIKVQCDQRNLNGCSEANHPFADFNTAMANVKELAAIIKTFNKMTSE